VDASTGCRWTIDQNENADINALSLFGSPHSFDYILEVKIGTAGINPKMPRLGAHDSCPQISVTHGKI